MGSGTGKTKRGSPMRSPVSGPGLGVCNKKRTGVPLPMAKPYSVMQMYSENIAPNLTPKATKTMTDRMDRE